MMRIFMIILCYCTALFSQAANLPTVEQGAQHFDQKMCVERYTNQCINTVCSTSGERHCQDKCLKGAKDKCKEQLESY